MCNLKNVTGDLGLISGPGRALGIENGNPFQDSCLGNSMDRGAWRGTVYGDCKESDMTEHTHTVNQTKKQQTHRYREQQWLPRGEKEGGGARQRKRLTGRNCCCYCC